MQEFMAGLGLALNTVWVWLWWQSRKEREAAEASMEQARRWLRDSQRENELYRGVIVQMDHDDHAHVTFYMNDKIIGRMVGAPLFVEAVATIVHLRELVTRHEDVPCPEEDGS